VLQKGQKKNLRLAAVAATTVTPAPAAAVTAAATAGALMPGAEGVLKDDDNPISPIFSIIIIIIREGGHTKGPETSRVSSPTFIYPAAGTRVVSCRLHS
jgi:hypothetical protein